MIFTSKNRSDATPKRSTESNFDFLDRVSWPEAKNVREFLNDCLSMYPSNEHKEMLARLASRKETDFLSSTFELLIYCALSKAGFEAHPHPALKTSSSRPDFIVTGPSGQQFYLEAVLASERGGMEQGAQARIDSVMDGLAKNPHANFYIEINSKGSPTTTPSARALVTAVHDWLDGLDPDDLAMVAELGQRPRMTWKHEDWQVLIRPIAISAERRGKATTLIGVVGSGARWSNSWVPIRDAVKYKGGKYGSLDFPLLIASNFDSIFLKQIDEMQALFGEEQFTFGPDNLDSEPVFSRAGNGAWTNNGKPSGQRVSGLWSFRGLSPYNLASCKQAVYVHPWALRPLPEDMSLFPSYHLGEGKVEFSDGLSLRELFALSEIWPYANTGAV